MTILLICCHLENHSTFLQIRESENSRLLKAENNLCKILDNFKFWIHILSIFKNNYDKRKIRALGWKSLLNAAVLIVVFEH